MWDLFSLSLPAGQARPKNKKEWKSGVSQLYTPDRNNQSLGWCAGDLYKIENTSLSTGLGSTSSRGEGCILYY